MARQARVVWAVEDTAAALHARYRAEKMTEVRMRLHALWLLRQGQGPTAVVGVGRNAVQRGLRWYREGGLDAVRARRKWLPCAGPSAYAIRPEETSGSTPAALFQSR